MQEMTYRERVVRTVRFETVDALPFKHAFGLMPGVVNDWHEQGLPASVATDLDVSDYFGFPPRDGGVPVDLWFRPAFDSRVLEDTPEYTVAIDGSGRTTKVLKEYASVPLALDFPVRDSDTWQDYKRRLVFSEDRISASLEKTVEANIAAGRMNTFSSVGFFWFPRELMGDVNLCIAYYEQPDLVKDMLETWCSFLEQALEAVASRVSLDGVHLGEDMAYKTSSMVGRPIFDEFMRPYYQRIHRIIQRHDVPVFSVDTDGSLRELLLWFREVGVNLIGPCEVNAGNDIIEYRGEFGRTMSFDGGLDKRVLLDGRDAIDSMLETTIPAMRESGGGWVIALDHRVLRGTNLADFQYYVDRVRELARF